MFTTPVAILTTPDNHKEITRGLNNLGYSVSSGSNNEIYDPRWPYVITDYNGDNNQYGNFRPEPKHYVARSIPEFLALASLTDEPIKVGDYVNMAAAGGWGYHPDNNGCIAVVTECSNETSFGVMGNSISGKILNPKRQDNDYLFNGIPIMDDSKVVVRKATKEELIALFSNDGDKCSPPKLVVGQKGRVVQLVPAEENNKSKDMKRILSRADFKRIHAIACSEWKPKLAEKFKDLLLQDEVEVDEAYYRLMRKACTTEQNALFDEIFGTDKKQVEYDDILRRMLVRGSGNYNRHGIFLPDNLHDLTYSIVTDSEGQQVLIAEYK